MDQSLSYFVCFALPCILSTLGASLIFCFKTSSKKLTNFANSLSAGIMFSASIWSLLSPAFSQFFEKYHNLSVVPFGVFFLLGLFFMLLLDFLCEKLLKSKSHLKKPIKFFTAMTIHNIPEGLAVGLMLGFAVSTGSIITSATTFAIGIAIQNFPEGFATALPLNEQTKNSKKSFILSFLSGAVEPVFALIGFLVAIKISFVLPFLLSFAGGTMIYIVVDELFPEFCKENSFSGTFFFCVGFLIMMSLDLLL